MKRLGRVGAIGVVLWTTGAVAEPAPAEAPPPVAAPAKAKAKAKPPNRKVPQPPPVDLAPSITALASTDVEVAARAAGVLGADEQPAAHEALLDALALGLPPVVAVPALAAVAVRPAPPDVAALRRYATHQVASVRGAALGALAMYPDPTARAAVIAGLHDPSPVVRAAAAAAAARGRNKGALEPLFALLARGEASAAQALAALADPELARKIAGQLGKVPEPSLALALGAILRRDDFGPDAERVELVHAIAKLQHPSAVTVLAEYLAATPATPPRPSRLEAQIVIDARSKGGRR